MKRRKRRAGRAAHPRDRHSVSAALRERVEQRARSLGFKTVWNTATKKMSEVIIEFAGPLLAHAQEYHEKMALLSLAVMAWNLTLFPENEQPEFARLIIESVRKAAPWVSEEQVTELLQWYMERKKSDFADCRRLILEYEFIDAGHEFRFNVASVPSAPKTH
jgi:hypothetical protein